MPVADKVKQIIVEQLGVDENQVEPSASFVDAVDYIESKKK
jgi:acyl carrier protein